MPKLIALFLLIFLPYSAGAVRPTKKVAPKTCVDDLTPQGLYIPDYEQAYAEILAWNAKWSVPEGGNGELQILSSEKAVLLKALDGSSPAVFNLLLSEIFGTAKQLDNERSYNEGFGLRMDLNSNIDNMRVTIQLTAQEAKSSYYLQRPPTQIAATIRLKRGINKINIPWQNFKSLDGQPSKIHPHLLGIKDIEFKIESNVQNAEAPSLGIINTIHRDLSLDWFSRDMETGLYFQEINNFDHQRMPSRFLQGGDLDGAVKVFQFVGKKYQNVDAQEYALNVIARGEQEIADELEKYGYEMFELDGKVTVRRFFNGLDRRDIRKEGKKIPIEGGRFAEYHGRYTHVAQLLTLLHNASPSERSDIDAVLAMTTQFNGWLDIWNVIFDAPGSDAPNAPGWWVNKFRERKIKTEPASGFYEAPTNWMQQLLLTIKRCRDGVCP